jgi:hypothetical protein
VELLIGTSESKLATSNRDRLEPKRTDEKTGTGGPELLQACINAVGSKCARSRDGSGKSEHVTLNNNKLLPRRLILLRGMGGSGYKKSRTNNEKPSWANDLKDVDGPIAIMSSTEAEDPKRDSP